MKKLMIGVLMGFMFLAVVSHELYADQCGCGGQMGMGNSEIGMRMGSSMMHHGPGFTEGFHHVLWQKLMRLGLSDKQKEALKAIKIRVTKDTIKKRADLELARVDLREILGKDPVDMSAVEANLKKAESVRTDLHLSHIKAMEEIKALLTPEQRKMFKEDIKAGFMRHEATYGAWHESTGPARIDEAQHMAEEK